MSLGYFPEVGVSRVQREMAVALLKSQLPGALWAEYGKVFDCRGKSIGEAEAAFRGGARANGQELEKDGFVGVAGKAARESLERIADKPWSYFSEGLSSVRVGPLRG